MTALDRRDRLADPAPQDRWQAVLDRTADDSFVYGVLTTGVYCRTTCASRRPKRENVRFYPTPLAAEADGLRPCKRCRPSADVDADPLVARMREVCAYIDRHADEPLALATLSKRAGLSPAHFQRRFTAMVGVSPKQYADARRLKALKTMLRRPEEQVTGAIFEAGYGSLSRVYEKADARLGMTPMEYRGGGAGVAITYATADTPLGLMMVGATDRGLCFVQFGDRVGALREALAAEYPNARIAKAADPLPPQFDAWIAGLNRYLSGVDIEPRLPVHVRATAFQLKVWTYLQSIPAGEVQSYQEVAKGIGQPSASRAVATACASNHVALVIPCHRVIRGSGELGGYKWGLERKRTLIDRERSSRGRRRGSRAEQRRS